MGDKRLKITGTGISLPEFRLTNDMLSSMVDTNDEWIVSHTGIKERRVELERSSSELAFEAAEAALADAGRSGSDMDFVITATLSPEYRFPATACLVQERVGAKNAFSFDVSAGCTGFIYALDLAGLYISSGRAKKGLVVATETLSKMTDYSDRSTCVLFGDGAGAAVVEAAEDGTGLLASYIAADCNDGKPSKLCARNNLPPAPFDPVTGAYDPALREGNPPPEYTVMNGRAVFEFAVAAAPRSLDICFELAGLAPKDISSFIIHQANLRIIDSIIRRYGLPPEKVPVNIDKYGNMSAVCVPVLLHETLKSGGIQPGDTAALVAFGAGLTYGAAILRF